MSIDGVVLLVAAAGSFVYAAFHRSRRTPPRAAPPQAGPADTPAATPAARPRIPTPRAPADPGQPLTADEYIQWMRLRRAWSMPDFDPETGK